MAKFSLAARPRLSDEICDFLREAIHSGRFAPGTVLGQEQLAEELDVSRTPLREALRVLQNEGLLTIRRGNRVEVVSPDRGRFLDALVMREVVDGAAARLCADGQLSSRQRSAFDRALRAQQEAIDPWDRVAFARADADLHAEILIASGNSYLAQQVNLVRLVIQVFQMEREFGPAAAAEKLEEHRSIVEAIAARDPIEAEARARDHIRRVIDDLKQAPVGSAR